jgi:hypothetical protein
MLPLPLLLCGRRKLEQKKVTVVKVTVLKRKTQ